MAGWFGRSQQSTFDDAPQPFELRCECGTEHSGLRRRMYQRVVCHTCGTSLFLLPKNVYPEPRPRKGSAARKPKNVDVILDADEVIDSSPVSERRRPKEGKSRKSRHQRRREGRGVEVSEKPVREREPKTSLSGSVATSLSSGTRRVSEGAKAGTRAFVQWWTPLKLTSLAIVVGVIAIGVWTVHSQRVEQAKRELNPAVEAGFEALAEQNLATAHAELSRAVGAIEVIGLSNPHSAQVRQANRETTALSNLLSLSLVEVIEEADELVEEERAERKNRPRDSEQQGDLPPLDAEWQNRFGGIYRDAWIVLEAPVQAATESEPEPRILFPIAVGPRQRTVEIRADFTVWSQAGPPDEEDVWIMAGALKNCRLSEDGERWIVELDPETGFLWSNMATYRMLDFPFTEWHTREQVNTQLERQRERLDIDALPIPEQPSDDDLALPESLI